MDTEKIYNIKDEEARKRATIATIITALLVLISLVLISFHVDAKRDDQEEGILVNFGTSSVGSGDVQPEKKAENPKIQPPVKKQQQQEAPRPQSKPKANKQPIQKQPALTQKEESAVINKPKTAQKEQTTETKDNSNTKPQPIPVEQPAKSDKPTEPITEPAPAPKQPDRLYGKPGGSKNTNSSGEGNDNQAGDKGQPDGSPSKGAYEGTNSGLGDSGVGYSLAGRKLINAPTVNDNTNIEGKITINIKVDQKGNVLSASLGKPTTISNSSLIQKSIAAAKRAKFDANKTASEEQFGTMTFIYKVR